MNPSSRLSGEVKGPCLDIYALPFSAHALKAGRLPGYLGSTLRGVIAASLKKNVCTVPGGDCRSCNLRYHCVYPYLFEPPQFDDTQLLRQEGNSPSVLFCPPAVNNWRNLQPNYYTIGDKLEFTILVFGKARRYRHEITRAVIQGLRTGLGRGRIPFIMDRNHRTTLPEEKPIRLEPLAYTEEGLKDSPRMVIEFQTPTRLKTDGRYKFNGEFSRLMGAILRRFTRLSLMYGEYHEFPYQDILQAADGIRLVDKDLVWVDWNRESSRQKTRMAMGGYVGRIVYEGDFRPFLGWLRAAEHVHIGKNTVFGLGQVEVAPA